MKLSQSFIIIHILLSFTLALPAAMFARQGTSAADTLRSYEMPQVEVIGKAPTLLDVVPGAGTVIGQQTLTRIDPISGNEVFRQVLGAHPLDEEGAGLRLNLSIRGLDPDRSRSVLMLEDGVPISLAPYGEPEMYYTPSIDRMSRLEVLKGSGSILFGPQTIGGVVNYVTADPPETPAGRLSLRGGPHGLFTNLIQYGTTSGNVGIQGNYLHRQADNLGTTRFRVNDLSAKLNLALEQGSRLGVKVAYYDENSNSTYVGLTQPMYDRGDYYEQVASDDLLLIRRYYGSATYDQLLTSSFSMRLTAFGYTTSRNWRRQDFDRSPVSGRQYTSIEGDTTVAGGAVYMRNSTGNRNRQFEVAGVEPRFRLTYDAIGMASELDFGARFLYERAFEQLILGSTYNSSTGTVRDDEIRTGIGMSAFVQNRLFVTPDLAVTPGLRLEVYDYERNIRRGQYNGVIRDTSIIGVDSVTAWIPGLGVSYRLSPGSSVFAGVHRGFAPPRVKDAITADGVPLELDPELSWNYEVGARWASGEAFSTEATFFVLDFSNQIIPVSQSSGGTGAGLVNGGRSLHKGVELGVAFDPAALLGAGFSTPLGVNGTWVEASYDADRFITSGGTTTNIVGNDLPYSPDLRLTATAGVAFPGGFSVNLDMLYVDEQFADELNTVSPTADGLIGVLESYVVLDINGAYELDPLRFSLSLKNLSDERYIVSRRPSGIRAGLPRTVVAGVEFAF